LTCADPDGPCDGTSTFLITSYFSSVDFYKFTTSSNLDDEVYFMFVRPQEEGQANGDFELVVFSGPDGQFSPPPLNVECSTGGAVVLDNVGPDDTSVVPDSVGKESSRLLKRHSPAPVYLWKCSVWYHCGILV
jgi:hypothetical protein